LIEHFANCPRRGTPPTTHPTGKWSGGKDREARTRVVKHIVVTWMSETAHAMRRCQAEDCRVAACSGRDTNYDQHQHQHQHERNKNFSYLSNKMTEKLLGRARVHSVECIARSFSHLLLSSRCRGRPAAAVERKITCPAAAAAAGVVVVDTARCTVGLALTFTLFRQNCRTRDPLLLPPLPLLLLLRVQLQLVLRARRRHCMTARATRRRCQQGHVYVSRESTRKTNCSLPRTTSQHQQPTRTRPLDLSYF